MKTKVLVLTSALLLSAASLSYAQAAGPSGDRPAERPGAGGQNGNHRPPHNPLLHLFDTNHDGTISADEIANASAALKALDKNGDGQLTGDELRPPRPQGAKGPQGGGNPPPPEEAP